MRILVTGGTAFVSRYTAEYFVAEGFEVYVLNRGNGIQSEGVHHIRGDRHDLGDKLRDISFDAVIDVCGYNADDIIDLSDALGNIGTYIFISSSAVYPEWENQPFSENSVQGPNKFWRNYGTDKSAAEEEVISRFPDHYILRPPYLYGPMNNVYREAFVFDCADGNRKFYIPRDGEMGLHFFHVRDLCRFIGILIDRKPSERIYNVGNPKMISIKQWVELCYQAAGKTPEFVNVHRNIEQRLYFSFYDYEYRLDVSRMLSLMPQTIPLEQGLCESYEWYEDNKDKVNIKPLIKYIEEELK